MTLDNTALELLTARACGILLTTQKKNFDDVEKKEMHDDEHNSTEKNHTNQKLKYGMYIVFGIIFIGIIKAIAHLFGSLGPIQDGINKVLGAGANALTDVTSGCGSQADCTKAKDVSSCNKSDGCAWSASSVSGEAGTCINTTGQKHHDNDALGCTLGLFGLFAFIAALLIKGVATFVRTNNPTVKEIALKTDNSVKAVMGKTNAEAREAAERVIAQKGITDAKSQEGIGHLACNTSLVRSCDAMMANAPNPEAIDALSKLKKKIQTENDKIKRKIDKLMNKEGAGEEMEGEINNAMSEKE